MDDLLLILVVTFICVIPAIAEAIKKMKQEAKKKPAQKEYNVVYDATKTKRKKSLQEEIQNWIEKAASQQSPEPEETFEVPEEFKPQEKTEVEVTHPPIKLPSPALTKSHYPQQIEAKAKVDIFENILEGRPPLHRAIILSEILKKPLLMKQRRHSF